MAEETQHSMEPVLHTIYNFKPKNANGYVKIYFESTLSDIVIDDTNKNQLLGLNNLLELMIKLTTMIQNKANSVIMTWSYEVDKNAVYPLGQIIYEQDTGVIRIADGYSKYSDLGNVKGAIRAEEINLDSSVYPIFEENNTGDNYDLGTVEAYENGAEPDETAKAAYIVGYDNPNDISLTKDIDAIVLEDSGSSTEIGNAKLITKSTDTVDDDTKMVVNTEGENNRVDVEEIKIAQTKVVFTTDSAYD